MLRNNKPSPQNWWEKATQLIRFDIQDNLLGTA